MGRRWHDHLCHGCHRNWAPTCISRWRQADGFDGPQRERGEADHVWPEFLPGSQAVLFTIMPATGALDNAQIAVLDLRTKTQTVFLRGGHHAQYVPSGHLVYGARGTLRAVAFDLERLAVVGNPVPVVEQLVTTLMGAVDAVVAANGTLAYVLGGPVSVARTLVWVDREGREEPINVPPRAYVYAQLSPDDSKVALDIRDQEQDIWIWDFARKTLQRLSFDAGLNRGPFWSPDGRRVAFSRPLGDAEEVYWQSADGSGVAEPLTKESKLYVVAGAGATEASRARRAAGSGSGFRWNQPIGGSRTERFADTGVCTAMGGQSGSLLGSVVGATSRWRGGWSERPWPSSA